MIPPGESFQDKFREVMTSQHFLDASPESHINAFLSIETPHDFRYFSQFLENNCKLQSFTRRSETTAAAVFRFPVQRFYCNPGGTLHGGAHAAIYDMLTGFATHAIGKHDFWLNGGVSRSLSCVYLRPAPEGKCYSARSRSYPPERI